MKCDCRICVNNINGLCSSSWQAHLDTNGKCISMTTDVKESFIEKEKTENGKENG